MKQTLSAAIVGGLTSALVAGLIFVTHPQMEQYAVAKDTFGITMSQLDKRLQSIETKQDKILEVMSYANESKNN